MSLLTSFFQDVLHLPCESAAPNPSIERTPKMLGVLVTAHVER